MARVKVYRFWVYDAGEDTSHLSPSYRTEAEIRRMGFEPAPETVAIVDETELDLDGRYHQPGADNAAT